MKASRQEEGRRHFHEGEKRQRGMERRDQLIYVDIEGTLNRRDSEKGSERCFRGVKRPLPHQSQRRERRGPGDHKW
jgi:hypothetical protein